MAGASVIGAAHTMGSHGSDADPNSDECAPRSNFLKAWGLFDNYFLKAFMNVRIFDIAFPLCFPHQNDLP